MLNAILVPPIFSLPPTVPRVVEFLTELHSTTVLEGEDATFKCVVSPEDVQLMWLMDNEAITLGDRFQASQNGLCHTLVVRKCQMLDCSKITAEAEGQISKANLKVQGKDRHKYILNYCLFIYSFFHF